MAEVEVKRGRGRPRLTAEEKAERALMRKNGELPTITRPDMKGKPALLHRQQNMEEGDNTRYVDHMLAIRHMAKIDTADPKQVERRIDEYFDLCRANDMKPSVMGMCNALGIARQTIWGWKTGQRRPGAHEEIILRAYDDLAALWEDYMQNGKINPMAGVFLGVNNFGYRDVKQVNLTPVMSQEPETIDLVALEAKYSELPED